MRKAAQGGHLEVIKFLGRKFKKRVHEKGKCSYTALHWAVQNGHCEVARYLIKELKLDPQDRDEVCALGCRVAIKCVPNCEVCNCGLVQYTASSSKENRVT